jgi:hypothetical protein
MLKLQVLGPLIKFKLIHVMQIGKLTVINLNEIL